MNRHKLQRWIPSVIAGLMLAGSASTVRAQGVEMLLATFDSDIAALGGVGGNSGDNPVTPEWSDVDNGSGGGSLKVTINWTSANPTGWKEIQLNLDQPGINAGAWLNVEFDLKIDQANSSLGPNGNYGFTQPVLQMWDGPAGSGWSELASAAVQVTNGWQRVSSDLSAFPGSVINRVVIRLASNGDRNVTNTVVYYIDNLKLTAPPLPPPTLGNIEPPTTPGLTLIPASGGQFQRVMVYPGPLGADFGWYDRGVPVTYSFTVTNFPTVNDYAANIYLIPNAHMRGAASDTAIDWNTTNGVFFNITANTENPATNWNVDLSVKTNQTEANPNFQLVNFNYPELPLGKWSLRFDNNTDFTIIAPNGFTTNGALPADVAALVSGADQFNPALTPYFGIMPRTVENIGEPAVYSRIQIEGSGLSFPVDDTFSTGELDTNTWSRLADYPPGIFVTTSDLLGYLGWNTPNDQGFQSLVAASSLTGPWVDLVPNSEWLLVSGTRYVRLSKAGVQNALGNSDTAFFAVVKRAFSQLQILLPGETAAPGTATGKTGTPLPQQVNVPFEVTVRAVDANWYPITGITDQVVLSSTDLAFVWPNLFAINMVNGVVTFDVINAPVYFGSAGNYTITASDATDPTKTSDTSPAVTVTEF